MKKIYSFLLLAVLPLVATSQTGPYWATDVAPIFYANCTKCHNPNGIAPFSLITYADAVANSANMSTNVATGIMPPWPPDTNYTCFCGERKLSQAQIQTIVDWVGTGMQQGNLSQAPTPPTYSGVAEILNPDLISQMPNYTVNTTSDLYRCFVMPSGVSTSEYITSIEVIPGNRSIVHHVLVYQDQSSFCTTLDNNDPGPGYTWFGDVGSPSATLIAGWVPGQGVYHLPANMGIHLNPNSYIIMQVHYPSGVTNEVDSTQVRFTFSSGVVRNVTLDPVINHYSSITNGPLFIPADSVKRFYAQETINLNATLISVAPHMHLIGQEIENFAVTPINDTIPLIKINDWDFHWQGFYNFRQPIHIPFGSVLYADALYDNTFNNPDNPNNPLQDVSVGENTTDEMFVIYYAYLNYQAGDENIIVDSTLLSVGPQAMFGDIVKTPQLYEPYPSPAGSNADLNIEFFLPKAGALTLEVLDISGKIVIVPVNLSYHSAGFGKETISLQGIAAGNYFIRMSVDGMVKTKKIIIE